MTCKLCTPNIESSLPIPTTHASTRQVWYLSLCKLPASKSSLLYSIVVGPSNTQSFNFSLLLPRSGHWSAITPHLILPRSTRSDSVAVVFGVLFALCSHLCTRSFLSTALPGSLTRPVISISFTQLRTVACLLTSHKLLLAPAICPTFGDNVVSLLSAACCEYFDTCSLS